MPIFTRICIENHFDILKTGSAVQFAQRFLHIIYRMDGTVLINRDIFEEYLERFHEPSTLLSKAAHK